MSSIIGNFSFRLTENDNLIGEYSNNHQHSLDAFPEAAKRVENGQNSDRPFGGKYHTTWIEGSGANTISVSAYLVIEDKPSSSQIYKLVWASAETKRIMFNGEGIVHSGSLVGHYVSHDVS